MGERLVVGGQRSEGSRTRSSLLAPRPSLAPRSSPQTKNEPWEAPAAGGTSDGSCFVTMPFSTFVHYQVGRLKTRSEFPNGVYYWDKVGKHTEDVKTPCC